MRGSSSIVVVALLLVVVSTAGCSRSAKYIKVYQCDALPDTPTLDAKAVWDCNRDVMVRAAKQKKFSLREFWNAAEFFKGLTGISADMVDSRQGPLPGAGLPENLDAWDAWYRENEDRLSWDPATRSVYLSAGSPG